MSDVIQISRFHLIQSLLFFSIHSLKMYLVIIYEVADIQGTGNTTGNRTAKVFALLVLTFMWMEVDSK